MAKKAVKIMAPGVGWGLNRGNWFLHVFIWGKYYKNPFKNHWTRKA
jgi:hypothetical protein